MTITPERFPDERRNDPKRRAEATVFDTLANCQRAGHVIYEWGAPGRDHRTDFALWLEGVGRYAIEVKGGTYTLRPESDQWYLQSPDGSLQAKSSPLRQADDAAMDLHNEIQCKAGFWAFVIPVVVFPDMARDPVIDEFAARTNVKVIWGGEHLLADLEAAARRVGIDHPPSAKHIRNEVQAVTAGANADEGAPSSEAHAAPSVEQLDLSAGTITIIIHNVERLIVQQAPDPTPDCGS